MIKYLVWDFDGTVVDTVQGIIDSQRETLRRMNLPDVPDEAIVGAIGLPFEAGFRYGNKFPEDRLEEAVKIYREVFFECSKGKISLFPGIRDALGDFRRAGFTLSLATSRRRDSLLKILDEMRIGEFFDGINICADEGVQTKPAPDMVEFLLSKTGFTPSETIVIGDTVFDVSMGNGAGCRTCAVTYGTQKREKLLTANPTWVVDSVSELYGIMDGLQTWRPSPTDSGSK